MIKPIRPPYFLILGALVGGIVLLTGGAFWTIRRSPDFYERRADRLVDLGGHLLASRQYAAAAQRAGEEVDKARLITKHCVELAKSDRGALEEEFKDFFNARETLLKTVRNNTGSSLPVAVSLRLFHQLAEISPDGEEWDELKTLMTVIDETKSGGPILERYTILYQFRQCSLTNESDADTLSTVVHGLEASQSADFDADVHFNLNLARLYLARALSETRPGEAYSLRQQATAPPPDLDDGAVNAEGIANQAALMMISEWLKGPAVTQSLRDVEMTALNLLEGADSPSARLSFAKRILVTSLHPPLNKRRPEQGTPTRAAITVLDDLISSRQQETLATWLLLTLAPIEESHAREKALLAVIRSQPDAAKGLLNRFVHFKLRMRAAQSHVLQILDALEKQPADRQYDDMLEDARDEADFLATLEMIGTRDKGIQSAFLRALIDRYGLEKRRGVVELRKVDQLFKEQKAIVKLQLAISLEDLGENGAALEHGKRAWDLSQQLPLTDRLKLCDLICQTLIRTGGEKEAERVITGLLAAGSPPPPLWTIAGRTFRGLADSPAAKATGESDDYAARAMTCLLRAVSEQPDDYRGWFELGILYAQQGDLQQAETNLKEALKRRPRRWDVSRALLRVLMARNRLPEAAELVTARLSLTKDSRIEHLVNTLVANAENDPGALLSAMELLPPGGLARRLALHDYYWRTGNPEADAILRELEAETPNHERVVILRYKHLLKTNDHQAVDALVDNNRRPLTLKSLQNALKGEHELYFEHPYSAMNSFQRALADDPWNSRVRGLLARACEEAMLPEQAIENLRQAIRINPANMDFKLALRHLSRRAGDPREAETVQTEAAPETPPNPDNPKPMDYHLPAVDSGKQSGADARIAWERIHRLLAQGDVETAVKHASEVLAAATAPAAFTRIGRLFVTRGLHRQALEVLANAPETVGTLGLIGESRHALNDVAGARRAFDLASQLAPDDPRPHIWRARLLERMPSATSLKEAELGYKTAISLQPNLSPPRVELIRLLERQKRYDEAKRELVALVGKWPDREDYRLWQCENALRNKQAESAATFIREARARRMTSPKWNYMAARTALMNDNPHDARRQLLKGLSRFKTAPPLELFVDSLIREGLFTEAEAVLKHLPAEMNSPRLDVAKAVLADRRNQPEKCLSHVQSALAALEDNPDDMARMDIRQVLTSSRIALLRQKTDDPRRLFLLLQCAWDTGAYQQAAELAESLSRKIDTNDPKWIPTRLILANACQVDGRHRQAAAVSEDLLKNFPTLQTVKNNLAYLYAVYLMRPEEAETLALAALAGEDLADATKAAYMDTLGLSFLYQQNYEQAVETLRDASRLLDSAAIRAHLGLAILKSGRPVEGRERILTAWRQAVSSGTDSAHEAETILETMRLAELKITPSETLALCQKHLREKRFARVRALMRDLPPLTVHPDNVLEHAGLLAELGDLVKGRELLNKARESELPPAVKHSLATLFNDALPTESQSIRTHLESQPSTPPAVLIDLARHRLDLGEFTAAEKIFERLIASPAPPPEAVVGFLATRLRRAATPLPDAWLETVSEKTHPSTGVKCLWAASQRDHEALSDFIRYVNNDPAIRPSDILAAGYFLLATEKPDYDLIDVLALKALQMDAADASTWIFRAVAAEDAGNPLNALEHVIQAVRTDPLNTTAVSLLGLKLAALNKTDDLDHLLDTYALMYQERPWFLVISGESARARGDTAKAERAFRQAFSLDTSPDTLYRLTQLLLDTRQAEEACETLARHEATTRLSAPLLALWGQAKLVTGDLDAALSLNARALNASGARDITRVVRITAATCPPTSLGKQFQIFREQSTPDRQQEKFIRHTFKDPDKLHPDRLRQLYTDSPRGSTARRVLGLLLTRMPPTNSLDQETLFDTLMAEYPQAPLVFKRFADHLLKKANPDLLDKANLAASKAVRLAEKPGVPDEKLADCLETLARAQIAMELINPAYRSVLRSVTLNPDTGKIFLLTEILVMKDAWLAAERELKRAEKLLPSYGGSISLSDIEALRKRIENRGKKSPVEP
ncbi:MAG: tetratricopeptide repeat protein [Lentisphaeria bacterium]|nr:tetratricopeptide repeat protein [Lentisphaeria bacterium]